MEITNGKNELAGLAPRCPKCGSQIDEEAFSIGEDPETTEHFELFCKGKVRHSFRVPNQWRVSDFSQFFRSPAPTPPLDVETEFDESESPTNVRELAVSIVDNCCGYTVEFASSPAHHRYLYDRITSYIQGIVNFSLRRHIASPAPQPEGEEYSHFDEVTPIETADRSQKKGEKFRIVNVNKNCYKLYLFGHFIGACSSEDAVRSREKSIADGINRYIHKAVKKRLQEAASPGQPEKRPKIICLCGSTRFIEQFAIQTWELELQGHIVLGCTLLPKWYCPVRDHFAESLGVKDQRDNHHLQKIDLADEVLVLNIGGYIGESTRNEIAYAEKNRKPVKYLEPLPAAPQSGKEGQ